MAITISPELEVRIQRVVASGRFATPEQAVEAAMERLEIDDPLSGWSQQELQTVIDEGLWSLENEPLMTPEEVRAELAQLRADLRRE
jgi:hypothetical protein